jgi:thiol:disulfide interchange protein DsbD
VAWPKAKRGHAKYIAVRGTGMRTQTVLSILAVFLSFGVSAFAAEPNNIPNISTAELVKFTVENQYDAIAPGTKTAVAVHFDVNKDWHFYSSKETAPGGVSLTIEPNNAEFFTFEPPIIPKGKIYNDKFTGTTTDILTEKFTVYLPLAVKTNAVTGSSKIGFTIRGALCSEQQCRMTKLTAETTIDIASTSATDKTKFTVPTVTQEQPSVTGSASPSYSTFAALLLAFVAGIILNIMPCVLPVIPLKVLSIFEQAKESKFRCITLGLTFCLGILVFFAVIAAANIILRLSYNSVFQWGDHFRNPLFIIGMALLMEVLALIMFGVATVTVSGRIAGASPKQGSYIGSIGMGFLAALLSTPCSFAILTAAFAWAQTQSLWLATVAIMIIGFGMAAPYALLTSMPSLLKHLPKPGRWMEIFKQAMGFVLLIVAVWLASVLPCSAHLSLFYYGLILAFCVWMWGGWVSFDTAPAQKWSVRIIAVIIAVIAGWRLLPSTTINAAPQQTVMSDGIAWQPYNAAAIKEVIADGKPVLIEFTADWCLTCKAVEKTVYARKDIQELLKQKNVLVVKGDTTWEKNPATIALKEVYNEPGVPVTIVHLPGKPEPVRLHGLVIGSELKAILEKL